MLTAQSPVDGTVERKLDPENSNFVYGLFC